MASPATAKALGFGACFTVIDPKSGERCGARVLWKVDKNGRVFADCQGRYDTQTCGGNNRNYNQAVSEKYINFFAEMREKENGSLASAAGNAAAEEVGDKPEGGDGEQDRAGSGGGEPIAAKPKSGYVFDQ